MNKVKLGTCLSVTRGASLAGEFYSEKGDKIRLTLGNFDYLGGGFKENSSKTDIFFIGTVKKEFILKRGDIITPLTEQVMGLLGSTAIIPENDKYIQSGDIGLVKPDLSKIDPNFLYYLLPTKYVKAQLGSTAQQTKIRHTSPSKIMDCYVFLPELELQKKIGSLLSNIDKKIQNNKKKIATLEDLARTIYDYWFIQFNFPNEEGKPYKSSGGKMIWNKQLNKEIPEGWTVNCLSELATVLMGSSPKGKTLNEEGKGTLFYQGSADFGQIFPDGNIYTTSPIRIAEVGDLLISVRAPIGVINTAYEQCCIGRGLAAIRGSKCSQPYLKNSLKHYELYFKILNSNGTTFGSFSKNMLADLKILLPTPRILLKFDSISVSYDRLIKKYEEEIRACTRLKNFLLPLLMNGQIKFKNN